MSSITELQETVWDYYRQYGRHDLPWRQLEGAGVDPYKVLVSELMLQQTQVPRVSIKFTEFMALFPTVQSLAAASLAEVLRAWSGLGYNRRAKFLWQAAQAVVEQYDSQLPTTREELMSLPGVGPNTAGAILAYAYNQPVVYIETNIRSVFIHHFFADQLTVYDRELLPLIEQAVPPHEARDWYWALMDYGTNLKQLVGNASRVSASYARQSKFEGSRRQVRGAVLRALADGPRAIAELQATITDDRLVSVIADLQKEAMVVLQGDTLDLAA